VKLPPVYISYGLMSKIIKEIFMKKNNKKFSKFLAPLLAIMMVISVFSLSVFAAEDDEITVTNESKAVSDNNLYVSCDYNSATEGYGTTKFSNYAGAYAYATANGKTNATIVVEKTNTLSGNTFDNNHKNYSKLAVVIKDGATMGNAASKWDMTYPVTVEPGGTLTCARPKSASVSYIHIKSTLTVGAEGATKKAVVDFLSDAYQDCDISIRYNGKVIVNNADFRVQDLDAQGTLTVTNSDVYVDGAFASATSFATTLTDSTLTVKGNQISGGISDFAGGTSNQLGNVKINNSTLTIEEGTTKVSANVTVSGDSNVSVDNLTVNSNKKITVNDTAKIEVGTLTNNGTIAASATATVFANAVSEGSTGKVTIDGVDAELGNNGQFGVSVAKIGTQGYETLQAAIDAAAMGDTIVLMNGVVITDTLTVAAGKTVTLELNGKTISQTKAQTTGYQMILNDGNLTIQDSVGGGKISYTDSGNGGEYISDTIYNRGTLVINGGTIENLSSATVASNGYPHAVDTYSGIRNTSVTINGGTVYCAEYSAIRMFCVSATYKADLVINGGTIKGAVDMQNGTKNAALGSLTITDGTFVTTKNANNIRFANWNGGATEYGITASVAGGSFNGGITTAYVPAAANWNSKIISGGTFTNDVSAFVADGYKLENGTVEVDPVYGKVAQIGNQYYATIQDAVAAANDGDVIVVIADFELTYTGNTIDGLPVFVAVDGKAVTIDLNGKKITGTSGSKNLNYYAAFAVDNDGSLTLKDSAGTGSVEITGTYTMYSLLMAYEYGANNATKLIVEGGSYYLENAHDSLIFCGQRADDLVHIKGGNFELGNIGVGENGKPWIFNVVGSGDGSAYVTGGTFNADVNRQFWSSEVYVAKECYTVDNGNGTWTVEEGAAAYVYTGMLTGPYFAPKNVGYKTFEEALAAAIAYNDNAVTLLKDVTLSNTVVINKAITLDGNGYTLTSTASRAINVSGADGVTIENLTIVCSGERAINVIQNATNVTINNVTATASNYTVNVAASAPGAVVTISNSTLNGLCTVNVASEGADVTITDSTINCNDDNTTAGESYAALNINKDATNAKITVTGSEINVADGSDSDVARISAVGGVITIDGSSDLVKTVVAVITYPGSDYYYGFYTLEDAVKFAKAGDTITIFAGTYKVPTMKAGVTYEGVGEVILEGTLSGTLENITLKNIHIKGANAQRWAYAKGDLVFENVTFEATSVYALHFDGITAGATLLYKNCTIIGWAAMSGSPASCVFDGCTIKGNGYYGVIRTYFDATINNCMFDVSNVNPDDVYQDGIHAVGATITVDNCTNVNGDMKDIIDISNAGYIVLDGETIHFHEFVAGETVAPELGSEGYTVYTCPCGETEKRDIVAALVAAAKIGETEYTSLANAINAANAGDTIVFLSDINENVTINNNLTIDGADFKYTGTMAANAKLNVTVQNVNFVNGGFAKSTKSNTGYYTIKGCTFDGEGTYAYAFSFKGANTITIENCDVSNYLYSFLYVSSGTTNVSVKNVTVENCPNYAVYFGSGVNTASFENLTVKNSNNGFIINNTANRTLTIKNCSMENVGTAINYSDGTNTITCTALGVNDFGGATLSRYANVIGVQVGTKIYETLADAWAAAQDGDTIKVLGNITLDTMIKNTKKITLDLNGKTITGTDNATGSFGLITNKGELTITGNGTITLIATNNRAWNAYSSVISNTVGGKLIVENGTIEHFGGTDMAYGIDNLTNGKGTYAETIVNGGTIKSTYRAIRMFLNGVEAQNILTINGGVVEGTNKSVWMQDPSKNANTGNLTVAEGATLNGDVYLFVTAGSTEYPVEISIAASAVNGEVLTANFPAGYILEKKNGSWEVNEYIAKVGKKYYKTLAGAIKAANQYQNVQLIQDAEGPGVVINKKTTIDFGGFTYTITSPVGSAGTESNGFQILAGDYAVRLLNGTLKVADDAADKFYILIQNYADLTVQKMTLDGTNLDKYALTDGDSYVLSNNSGSVNVNMTKIFANNDGDKAYAFDVCDQTKYGYELPRVTVYYGTATKIEGKIEAVARVGNTFYATLQQAIDTAAEGKTIELLVPVVVKAGETLNLNKKVTVEYTSNVPGEDMITNRGTVIIDGAILVYVNTDTTASNVTVSTISCEPGSVLEVKSGAVKNNSQNNGAKGIYAFAIDMLTNGNMGDVTVTVSGGKVIGTNYMAIRQFNNSTTCKNTLNVTGGEITAAKRAIQIHLKNNYAYTNISGGVIEAGDYALCFLTTSENIEVTGGTFKGYVWYSGTDAFITGGSFDTALNDAYVVAGYKATKVDGIYTVAEDPTYGSEATIGDVVYKTFADAWNAAKNGDTIVLQNNITVDTKTFTVVDGMKITLDMNGYIITVTDNKAANVCYELFYIYGEMVVTGDGTINLTSTSNDTAWAKYSTIFHNRGGVLTIENGTFAHLGGTCMAFVVDNSGNWYGDAVTTINGGALTSTYTAIRNRMEQNTHGASGKTTLNVYGGTINGTTSAIWAQAASTSTVAPATGAINIYGGEIGTINTARSEGAISMTTIAGGTVASFKGESGELTVNGGKITGNITIMFANGDTAEKVVIKKKVYYAAVAKMGNTYYATLEDAINACKGYQSVNLMRDIEGAAIVIDKKVTLDFAGHTYTVTAPTADGVGFKISTTAAVRLVNGTIKAADNAGITVLVEHNGTGKLTIQKQTLEASNVEKAVLINGGSVDFNYAIIKADGAVAFEITGSGVATLYTSSKIEGGIEAKKSSGYKYVAKED